MAADLSAAQAALVQAIAEEAGAIRQFVDLLKREQASLSNGITDELPELAEQKGKLFVHLNQLAAQRTDALAAQGLSADRAGVEAWFALHTDENSLRNEWTAVLSLASEARELNRLNGELIRMRMQYNAKALEALQGGKGVLDLYGPDGQSTSPGHSRIYDAV